MTRMTNACNLLAQHIQKLEIDESLYGELKFLRTEIVELLLSKGNQEELFVDFEDSKNQEEIQNPWLRELTQDYFQN